jgi:hypothetical protein
MEQSVDSLIEDAQNSVLKPEIITTNNLSSYFC